ncbi:phosphodiester glycosidase family protein [Archangium primigenium]|uniref:phosphodiester glycosidase family protein n=1 Tax=[Archangium] primigenium TaxID=2792470 RepID=UPI0019582D5D|nr:phosphodiester glycosidase family protein [Archangium primigenium]MBM7115393.1 phosphodiester glycosidase family protein [Archangium primigenium]
MILCLSKLSPRGVVPWAAALALLGVLGCGVVPTEPAEPSLARAPQSLAASALFKTNLLANPDAETGDLSGWSVIATGGEGWTVRGAAGERTFHTSYGWSRREQVIDLHAKGFSAAVMAKAPPIHVGEVVRREYCADNYTIRVELLDAQMNLVTAWDTGTQSTGGPCEWSVDWRHVEHTFTDYGPQVRFVRFRDGGQSTEIWAGHYGPVFDDAFVQVSPPAHPDTFQNLLLNYDAEHGDLSDWQITENGGAGWQVAGAPGSRYFQTSYGWNRRVQVVDLYAHGFDAATMARSPLILVKEKSRRSYCPDSYYLKVQLLDAQMAPVAQWDSGVRTHAGPCAWDDPAWEQLQYTFMRYGPGVRYVRWEDGGRDSESWGGPYGAQLDEAALVVYGDNLLTNPWANDGTLSGWQVTENGGYGYALAPSGVGDTRAVQTSAGWFRRNQIVDLASKGYTAEELDEAPVVYASELFGRTYCPDDYYLKVELLRADMSVLASWNSGVQRHQGPCEWSEEWRTLSHIFERYGPGLRYIRWEDGGRDTEFWATHYGAKLDGAFLSLRPETHAHSGQHARRSVSTSAACGGLGQPLCHHKATNWCWTPAFWVLQALDACSEYDYCDSGLAESTAAGHLTCQCPTSLARSNSACLPTPQGSISVTQISGDIDIEGYPKILRNVKGHFAIVRNARHAQFFVPNSPEKTPNCDVVGKTPTEKAACRQTPPSCATLNKKNEEGKPYLSPLYTVEQWGAQYPAPAGLAELRVNGNWFDIRGTPGFPYKEPCTNIIGYSVSNGQVVSIKDEPDRMGSVTNYLDALIIRSEPGGENSIHFAPYADIGSYTHVKHAVGGFLLVKDGKVLTPPSSAKPDAVGARTVVGIDKSDNLIVAVVEATGSAKGLNATDIAHYMKRVHKAQHVINLDNSGSSQFFFKKGTDVTQSQPGDNHPDNYARVYRPVPNFLSIRVPEAVATPPGHDEL